MDNLSKRLATLSPEKRTLLERHIRKQENKSIDDQIKQYQNVEHPPLSFAQQRLWFLEQLESGHSFYNLPFTTQFDGSVSPQVLERSLNEIIRRHESLRTTFELENGEPLQIIAPEQKLQLEIIDIASLPEEEINNEARRLISQEAMHSFDLSKGPLFRAKLFKLSETNQILLMTMHHIVSDGWSMGVLYRELNAIYKAYSMGKKSPLPDLPMQYSEFAIWQRNYLTGNTLERLMSFWKSKLENMPTLLELPTDHIRPRVQNFQGGTYSSPYPKTPIDALKIIARQEDATFFMVLLAVFKVLIYRFSGIRDLVVGTPVANRNRVELEGLIGFFVNTLVLRTKLLKDPTFREVISFVREVTLEAISHQDLPFERLVEELQPNRTLSHNPLFQVMFGLQNNDMPMALHNSPAQFNFGVSKFDLTLNVTETGEGLTGVFEFNSELFEPQTISSLANAYGNLLRSASENPDEKISKLSLLNADERKNVIKQAETEGKDPPFLLIHKWFEAQTSETPNATAVIFGDQELTYKELDTKANKLAQALQENGIGPDSLVGICMDRAIEFPISMLGIWKAGAAFVPIDPVYPKKRLEFMLEDTSLSILLTQTSLLDRLQTFGGEFWCLDTEWSKFAEYSNEPPEVEVSPENLAYVIYTSGSTGRPKGVMVNHKCVCYSTQAQIEVFSFSSDCRVLQFGSLSFDTSIFDLLMIIGCGGTLCLAPQEDIMPGQPLAETIRKLKINAITIPPSAINVVPVTSLPSLHTLILGGEAPSLELIKRWQTGRRLFNAYGPTETTIWTTIKECTDNHSIPPIGQAIPNTQIYVLDANLEPMPVGWVGQIYVGGAGVARGYLNRSDLTSENYVPDPFSQEPGVRLYQTGDRGKLLANEDIQYIGRFDHQLKLRGYRIELGEIESVLLKHPDIAEGAVITKETSKGDVRIVAYAVKNENSSIDRADLLTHLRESLPEFMIPAALHIIEAFPLNVSGKLDRAKLSHLTEPEIESDKEWVAPETVAEKKVAEIFCEVLELESIGSTGNFFEMGGHSLLATRAITRINDFFEVTIPLRAIFEFPTVGKLAASVDQFLSADSKSAQSSITKIKRQSVQAPELNNSMD